MSAKELIEAIVDVGASPCERGCQHFKLCKTEQMACLAFADYYISGKYSMSKRAREPSRKMYTAIMEGGVGRRGMDDILSEEDLNLVKALKAERRRLINLGNECREQLKGLTDTQIAKKFSTKTKVIAKIQEA